MLSPKLYFVLILAFLSFQSKAQNSYGVSLSPYGGLNAVSLNPANLSGNPYGFYMELINMNVTVNQNILSTNFLNLATQGNQLTTFKNKLTDSSYIGSIAGTPNKSFDIHAYATTSIPMLNLLFSVGRKHAFALSTKVRTYGGFNDWDFNTISYKSMQDVNTILQNGFDITVTAKSDGSATYHLNTDIHTTMNFKKASIKAFSFAQVGLSYGTVLWEQGAHTIRGGLTAKYLLGMGLAVTQMNNFALGASFQNEILSVQTAGKADVFYNQYAEKNQIQSSDMLNEILSNMGFGLDIGGVYEWNPDYQNAKVPLNILASPYKLKVGLSIVDLGVVNYATYHTTLDYTGASYQTTLEDVSKFKEFSKGDSKNMNTSGRLALLATNVGGKANTQKESISIGLPTMMHLYGDYHLYKGFYVAANLALNISGILGKWSIPTYSQFVLAPRFQMGLLDISVPLSFIPKYLQFKAGVGLRISCLFVGSDDILGIFTESHGAGVYAGLSLPIRKSRAKLKKYYEYKIPEPVCTNPSKVITPSFFSAGGQNNQTDKSKENTNAPANKDTDKLLQKFNDPTLPSQSPNSSIPKK